MVRFASVFSSRWKICRLCGVSRHATDLHTHAHTQSTQPQPTTCSPARRVPACYIRHYMRCVINVRFDMSCPSRLRACRGLSGASREPVRAWEGLGRPRKARTRIIHKSDSPHTQVRLILSTSLIRLIPKSDWPHTQVRLTLYTSQTDLIHKSE